MRMWDWVKRAARAGKGWRTDDPVSREVLPNRLDGSRLNRRRATAARPQSKEGYQHFYTCIAFKLEALELLDYFMDEKSFDKVTKTELKMFSIPIKSRS